jgi:acyl carrier protein
MTAIEILTLALGLSGAEAASAQRGVTEQWDSLHHVELMFLIEEETGHLPTPEQLAAIHDLRSLENCLRNLSS